jgi:flavorubredoxin
MPSITLFERGAHRNILIEDFGSGMAVQANQHLVVHRGSALILDPGGHKVYNRVLTETLNLLGNGARLEYVFLSHQDPDVVAATNGWLMTTDAHAWISSLWMRFIPHFGLDRLVDDRLSAIPDEGMLLPLGGDSELMVLPAHFLHSPGNFQIYDPISRILYSGDLGSSLGIDYRIVSDFDSHVPFMEGFHRRYVASNRSTRAWAKMVRKLDIETIAPQHGALFSGAPMVAKFIDWCESLVCGVDLLDDAYQLPTKRR